MPRPKTFPEVVKALRQKQGWSVTDLALRCGLSRATLYFLEAGQFDPKLSTLRALVDALGIDPKVFFEKGV